MIEEWRQIRGYEGHYEVSNHGRVLSCARTCAHSKGGTKSVAPRILKPGKDKNGYLQVHLSKGGKTAVYKIHRLVAQAFVCNPHGMSVVNHKDENKQNNRADNLEFCTREYNIRYGTGLRRSHEKHQKPVVCVETATVYPSAKIARDKTGAGHISECCKNQNRTSGGYHWRFYDGIKL